jgi:hypothetical protein
VQAIRNRTAKTVKAAISLTGATLVMGGEKVDLGHLPGNRSLPVDVEWLVKADGANATAVITAISEKGGTHSKQVKLQ